jgi:hypothetical protein
MGWEEEREEERPVGEKWARDPLGAIFFGLILLVVAVVLLLGTQGYVEWEGIWAYFLVGLGVIFWVEALVRFALPAYRRPIFGRLILGLILVAVGATNIYGLAEWWPVALIVVALAVVLYGIVRLIRPG